MIPAAAEYSLVVTLDRIGTHPTAVDLSPNAETLAKLSTRFGLAGLSAFRGSATVVLVGSDVRVTGDLQAMPTYVCRVSGQSFEQALRTGFDVLFRADAVSTQPEEIELVAGDLDIDVLDSHGVDVGELAAQSMGLALDPWPRAPDADESMNQLGVLSETDATQRRSPFAKLLEMKDGSKKA